MLGSLKQRNAWKWVLFGKHQVAKDYFLVGSDSPLLKAFADWFENGYAQVGDTAKKSTDLKAWRFWAQGSTKELICGFARDSHDNIGRPYPLVVVGAGPLEGWRSRWDLIPFAFDRVWSHLEYFSNKRFLDFRQMEDEVRMFKHPEPMWKEFEEDRNKRQEAVLKAWTTGRGFNFEEMKKRLKLLNTRGEMFAQLCEVSGIEPVISAALWHTLMKESNMEIPNVVFLGGGSREPVIAVYRRALSATDFVRLWGKLSMPKEAANGTH